MNEQVKDEAPLPPSAIREGKELSTNRLKDHPKNRSIAPMEQGKPDAEAKLAQTDRDQNTLTRLGLLALALSAIGLVIWLVALTNRVRVGDGSFMQYALISAIFILPVGSLSGALMGTMMKRGWSKAGLLLLVVTLVLLVAALWIMVSIVFGAPVPYRPAAIV